MKFKSVLLLTVLFPLLAFASENIEPEDYSSRFSLEESQASIEYVADALSSFRKLTEKSPKELTEQVDNTGWDIQNLGFINWVDTVTGTLLLQHYQIAELRYQALTESTSMEEKKKAEQAMVTAKEQYQEFTSKLQVMD
ncbi:hypothetical protein AHAT_11850 [Agarivorans sp. Toyoura001]|uniref:hypothetical protein n=1 Tax=Agarivorans sp. Toyoura001 TaxID=2283141 RepID=UPI0010D52334|nr:hypothetical protein [Agarivorans sp. Toyoura001]GDY25295.1 hypothetical protein AHAT_11850 [Agarivorans sp. Toyoura001]